MWETIKFNLVLAYEMLREAGRQYGEDRATRMAAAVSYRTLFAAAPLLLVAVSVFGLVLGSSASAQREILNAVQQIAGSDVADAVALILQSVQQTGGTAGVIGAILLLWTASSLFMELQNDLNDIFGVPYEYTAGVVAFIKKRGLGFLAVLGLGLVLVAVWLLNGIWQLIESLFPDSFEPIHRVIGFLTPIVSLIVLPFVLALTYQVLCQLKVRWRAIWWGSFYTSIAFLLAAHGTGLYFRYSGTSAAGVAGSVVVILLLAFVLSSVYIFGAEVIKIYHNHLETGFLLPVEESPKPLALVGEPEPAMPLAAVLGFLGGLFVGWRRKP